MAVKMRRMCGGITFRYATYSSDSVLHFAQELFDYIIDHLWDNPAALGSAVSYAGPGYLQPCTICKGTYMALP
ncbi:hypothetical protein DAEQUDRAFT_727704 [Daedalea quercina L-15889]|uniref:Uncharacterized protein n=1 Tax=Daedalea quercina L-15889 TaxID=1314783 RepID=A0A165PSP1_9APHY|nr:hypothetical protein DAEQUDRAFT_727704 [Daedalea quercina L-15889]